jgi:hypothetical protein
MVVQTVARSSHYADWATPGSFKLHVLFQTAAQPYNSDTKFPLSMAVDQRRRELVTASMSHLTSLFRQRQKQRYTGSGAKNQTERRV